jgi:hypothetical protein
VIVQEEPSSKLVKQLEELKGGFKEEFYTLKFSKRFPQECGLYEVKIGSDATLEVQRVKNGITRKEKLK